MMSGSMCCVKYLMFTMNFVFVVCGVVLIVIGAVVQTNEMTMFLDSKYVTVSTILIVTGCIVFLLAFFGCYGAVSKNFCMVTTFGVLLFVVFVVEIAGAATAYMYRDQFVTFLKENMNTSIAQDKPDARFVWAEMQIRWNCCGIDGPQDYLENNLTIPISCCEQKEDECEEENARKDGCYTEVLKSIKRKIGIFGGVAIGIGVVELIGVIFACCLSSAIKNEYEVT